MLINSLDSRARLGLHPCHFTSSVSLGKSFILQLNFLIYEMELVIVPTCVSLLGLT